MSDERTQFTYCRICEALCGLEVRVRGEDVVDVRPDPQHPVSRGFACVKGVSLGSLHHDPDRLNHPLARVGDRFERVRYERAMRDVGERLRAIRERHGPRSVAVYTGNPTFFNYKSFFFAEQLVDAFGTPNLFASHSVDCNNKFLVSQLMYGLPTIHPVVDLERVRFLMVLGGNPAVSQMSFIQAPNAIMRLKQITRRGGRVVIVDPRRTETARQVGEHVAIRPGTDAHLLLAMAQVIVTERLFDRTRAERHTRGLADFERAVEGYTPERAEPTGIAPERIRELARAYAAAEGAALYMSTGVNMGPFGSIAYWVLQTLNVITGNVDRAGGLLEPKGPFDLLRLTRALGVGTRGRTTRDGRFRGVVDALPVGALADEILRDGKDRIRALIVNAGNPLLSVPGPDLARALGSLELLVCIDIYPSETTRLAHYVFPATDMLERSDYPLTTSLNQETPVAQFTERVVAPLHERKEEWEIFCDLVLASRVMAKPTLCHVFGAANRVLARTTRKRKLDPDIILRTLLALGDVGLDELRKHPHGLLLPRAQPGSFLGKRVYTAEGRVDLAPKLVLDDLPRLARSIDAHRPQAGGLVLIGRRDKRSHNSWMHNNPGIDQPQGNRVLVHPDDARARGITQGALVELEGGGGRGVLPAELTEDVSRGVVVAPHDWGHANHGGTRARSLGGLSVNGVIPGGPDHLEPVSGQAIMVGHAVELRPVARLAASDEHAST